MELGEQVSKNQDWIGKNFLIKQQFRKEFLGCLCVAWFWFYSTLFCGERLECVSLLVQGTQLKEETNSESVSVSSLSKSLEQTKTSNLTNFNKYILSPYKPEIKNEQDKYPTFQKLQFDRNSLIRRVLRSRVWRPHGVSVKNPVENYQKSKKDQVSPRAKANSLLADLLHVPHTCHFCSRSPFWSFHSSCPFSCILLFRCYLLSLVISPFS